MQDCPYDYSDEENCALFRLENPVTEYDKDYPPVNETSSDKVKVTLKVHIQSLQDINELDLSITLRLSITLIWNDHRLVFKNLQENQEKNLLSNQGWSLVSSFLGFLALTLGFLGSSRVLWLIWFLGFLGCLGNVFGFPGDFWVLT